MADSQSMDSGMQGHLNLRDAPPPLIDFDNSDAVPAANAQTLMHIQPAGSHKDVIMIYLLKGWCEANGKTPSKSQRLYKKMYCKFLELKVISPEALKDCNYNIFLKKLASWSLSSSSDDSPDGSTVLPFIHNMSSPDHDDSSYCQDRYKKDFIQQGLIGEGSYGRVYKVQHKLDKEHYAIKKIKVTKKESRSLQREIKTLACLNHPNIVRYHQSWLEGEVQVVSQQTEKQPLMLALRSFNDMGISYKGEEEERKEIENDEDDSCHENESISKLGSTSPIITEFVETRCERHSQQTSMTVSMNRAEIEPFDPNFTVPFEFKRFNSGELVNEFFSQTNEDVENIWPLVYNKKEEECDSVESSGTSGSKIVFQNVESDGRDCDEFNLPSLKEQNSSRVEFVRQLHIETSSKSEIKITTTTNSKTNVQNTIIPVTSATSAFLSTLTSSLSSSTHIQNRICAAPSRSQQPIRDGKFRSSSIWYGQESSSEVDNGHCPQSKPLFKRRYYLHIQTELCLSTLGDWLDKRNKNMSKTENQFDVVNDEVNRNIFKQILEGMNYIHGRGIRHRDVTPKNIFLSDKDDGQLVVKIGDFGLAREDVLTEPKTPMRLRRDRDLDGTLMCRVGPCVSRSLTSGIGTVEYVAPEQYNDSTYDNKCDMYSLGLILLELYHPFRRISDKHKCFEELLSDGKIPKELQERWPVQCSAIQSLTSYDSAQRPSAADLLSGDMFLSKDKTKLTEKMTNKLNSEQAKVTELTNALDTTQMQLVEARAGLAEKRQSELVLADRVLELEASCVSLHAELTAEQQETVKLKKQTELQDGSLAESVSKCVLLEQQIVTKDNVQKDMQQKIEVLEKELAKERELFKNYKVKLKSKIEREPAIRQRNAEISQVKENRIPKSRQTSGQQPL